MRGSYIWAWLLAATLLAMPARAQEAATPPERDAAPSGAQEDAQLASLRADVDRLKRLKISGYVQARWETGEAQSDTVKVEKAPAVVTPANNERFYIRRARLKVSYDSSPWSQGVVYFDGGQDRSVRLLEAYVTLIDPWTPNVHRLTIGQMNVPFGYEVEYSSSARELPERSRAENVLFPGERDRGIKLVSAWTPWLETVFALLNGGGVSHPDFPNTDPTRAKDFLGRARWSQGALDAAVSYYGGKEVTPLTGPDVETDKTRLGFDAQLSYELTPWGEGSVRGEFYAGKNLNADSVKALVASPTAGNPVTLLQAGADPGHLATDFVGWYAMWVQDLGERFQLAVRYDAFDPNTDLDRDQFERVGLGLNWFFDRFTRVTVAYDIPRTERRSGGGRFEVPKDNLWTVQFQHKF